MATGRLVTILVAAALAGIALSACSGAVRGPAPAADAAESEQTGDVPTLRVITPQGLPEHDQHLLEIIASLRELNPSVEITASISSDYDADLAEALASRTPPDVFLVTGSTLPDLVEEGAVVRVPDGLVDRSKLLQAAAAGIEVNGETYCFPHSVRTLALVYNVDLFEEAGVAPPSSAWTWQDLAAAASALTDADAGTVGLVLEPDPLTWMPFYLQAGGMMRYDDQGDVVLESEPAAQAARYFASLFADGSAATPAMLDAAWAGEAFAAASAGMTIAGDWIVPYLDRDRPGLRYGTAELPGGPVRKGNIALSTCLAVHADSTSPDLALQLAAQLTAPEVLSGWTGGAGTGVSIYDDQAVSGEQDRLLAPYLRALRYAQPWRLGRFSRRYAGLFSDGIEMIVSEEMEAADYWSYLARGGVPVSQR